VLIWRQWVLIDRVIKFFVRIIRVIELIGTSLGLKGKVTVIPLKRNNRIRKHFFSHMAQSFFKLILLSSFLNVSSANYISFLKS